MHFPFNLFLFATALGFVNHRIRSFCGNFATCVAAPTAEAVCRPSHSLPASQPACIPACLSAPSSQPHCHRYAAVSAVSNFKLQNDFLLWHHFTTFASCRRAVFVNGKRRGVKAFGHKVCCGNAVLVVVVVFFAYRKRGIMQAT